MEAYARYETFRQEAKSAEELLSDPEMKDLARETLSEARSGMERTAEELKILLLPKDPDDGKNVIVEIRGGVGGEEKRAFWPPIFSGCTKCTPSGRLLGRDRQPQRDRARRHPRDRFHRRRHERLFAFPV